jgi:hypothetical protein
VNAPILVALALVTADGAAAAAQPGAPCRTHPDLVGRCRTVHGRLSVWNGTPSLRIWIVGTRRILGVSEWRMAEMERDLLPANVWAAFGDDPPGRQLFGDFLVCPFARERPRRMQMVCVARATRLHAVRR